MIQTAIAIIAPSSTRPEPAHLHCDPMRTLVRLIVMWLIAVALLLQGVAAATMLHCGSAPQQRSGVPSSHSNHAHAHRHAHEHHAGMHTQGAEAGASSHQHSQLHAASSQPNVDSALHHHAGGTDSCSVCASCCGVAALPVMPLVLASQDRTEATVAVQDLPTVVFLTDGPERPPRSIFA
jgi:hypothetical protein